MQMVIIWLSSNDHKLSLESSDYTFVTVFKICVQ